MAAGIAPRLFASGAPGTLDFETEEGRTFLQERLAVLGQVGFLVDSGFFILSNFALSATAPDLMARRSWSPGALLYGLPDHATQALFLGTWLLTRSAKRPLRFLRFLDGGVVVAACFLTALPFLAGAGGSAPYVGTYFAALLVLTNVLLGRAIIVPSNPRRTFGLGLVCAAPLLIGVREFTVVAPFAEAPARRVSFLIPAVLWSLCAIALSTLASGIIYGLRRRVHEARRLGQYTLEEKVGEGGMGTVFRARHAMLRRPTAVKLLRPEHAGVHNLKRFEREVQMTALLSHPNTVAIYDYGRTPEGIFYYAMEYLEGLDLEALVRDFGAQPAGRVIHILRQVAGALGEAHGAGLIHRDVKPGNVILCERGGVPDVAKVVDFGLVRDLSAVRRASATALDIVTGTPLYLSPEAITAPERVDGRSDIYALGAVGYFLLAGRSPFDGATVIEVCAHHLYTFPEPPSVKHGRPLPADLEAVILCCLEKDPARRPQSAAELEERLGACASVAEWSDRTAREWWRRYAGQVREIRWKPGAREDSPLPTIAVSLEGRLVGAGERR